MNIIERIERPTVTEFQENFLKPQKPCIISGAIDDWQALSLWTVDYLKSTIGKKVVKCRVSTNNYFDNFHQYGTIRLSTYLDWIVQQTSPFLSLVQPQSQKKYFVGSKDISTFFPELLPDLNISEYVPSSRLVSHNLWIGHGNNRVNLHYDIFHNLNAQIVGQKRWVIFPPEQTALLYPYPWYSRFFWCSQVNINKPDLDQFPQFIQAEPIEVVVNPGEMIFLPARWWHSPIGVGLNIAVNFWWRLSLVEILQLIQSALKVNFNHQVNKQSIFNS